MRHCWAQLAMMALDIPPVVSVSDESERQCRDAGRMITNRRSRLRNDIIAVIMSVKSLMREHVFGWTNADVKVLTMNTRSNMTNVANVTNQSSSNQLARSTNRPIQRVLLGQSIRGV
jgi:hypothetical protein